MVEISIGVAQTFAMKRGGECLSIECTNGSTKIRWRCSQGHEWDARYDDILRGHEWDVSENGILQGTWCFDCILKSRPRRVYSIEDCRGTAESHGGKCLSNEYANTMDIMKWQCSEGHEWEEPYNNIRHIQTGSWCPVCKEISRGLHLCDNYDSMSPIDKCHDIAKIFGGECLSDEYSSHNKMKWRCSQGHEWLEFYDKVTNGSWCPVCAGKVESTYNDAVEAAESHGGKCLSIEYLNDSTLMKWQCSEGHKWDACYGRIKYGAWCPTCHKSRYISEGICRRLFEEMTGYPFSKVRPKWLRGSKGRPLELDGYNKTLRLAFEYQGAQHYQEVTYFKGSFVNQQKNDAIKRLLCKSHNVDLIEVPYWIKHDEMGSFIADRLSELGHTIIKDVASRPYDIFAWELPPNPYTKALQVWD